MSHDKYENPLVTRYAGQEMASLFGMERRIRTWRTVWIALAEAQRDLGLPVNDSQIESMRKTADDINWDRIREIEAETRHDVMANIHAWGESCPDARPIIHLGATSAFVTDNADLILIRDGLDLLATGMANALDALGKFSRTKRDRPCLGLTHLQPAQPVTLGKRAAMWARDLLWDLLEIERIRNSLLLRGAKGTTGTQASFLELFDGDADKVLALDDKVAKLLGFPGTYTIVGQTYPRKIDVLVLGALAGLAASASKFSDDIRLMQSTGELLEPTASSQVGSSAMAYKRNPMRSERMGGLARFLASMHLNAVETASHQWGERTLDDSANRRIVIPESFLAADGILRLWQNVARGLETRPKSIQRRLDKWAPFLATEAILMAGVKAGGDRQDLHERIREHANEAREVMETGQPNDLLDRLGADPAFAAIKDDLPGLTDPASHIGLAPDQVDRFLREELNPALARYKGKLGGPIDLEV